MDLFASDTRPQQLVDDAEGGIRYWPRVVDTETAVAWFDTLRDGVRWQSRQRPMYERVVAVPRLLAAYRVDAFPADLPLARILARVQRIAPAPYTGVGLNLYRDGQDGVAMHGDTLRTLAPGQPLALLSLGAPRRMLLRSQQQGAKAIAVELEPGSVLVMSHASQVSHLHGIPKTVRPVGPRISVVLRVRAAGAVDEDREALPSD